MRLRDKFHRALYEIVSPVDAVSPEPRIGGQWLEPLWASSLHCQTIAGAITRAALAERLERGLT